MACTHDDAAVPLRKFLEIVDCAAISVGPAHDASNMLMQAQTALEVISLSHSHLHL